MEASEVVEAPAEGESADGTEVDTSGVISTFDSADDHQPISEHDAHGSVSPSSALPPQRLSGDPLDPSTKAANAGHPPAEGGPTP